MLMSWSSSYIKGTPVLYHKCIFYPDITFLVMQIQETERKGTTLYSLFKSIEKQRSKVEHGKSILQHTSKIVVQATK